MCLIALTEDLAHWILIQSYAQKNLFKRKHFAELGHQFDSCVAALRIYTTVRRVFVLNERAGAWWSA